MGVEIVHVHQPHDIHGKRYDLPDIECRKQKEEKKRETRKPDELVNSTVVSRKRRDLIPSNAAMYNDVRQSGDPFRAYPGIVDAP
jgi:hypothetical protein